MNFKTFLIALVGLGAIGYYAYDQHTAEANKPVPAKTAKKGKSKSKSKAKANQPAEEPAAEVAAAAPAVEPVAEEPAAAPAQEPEAVAAEPEAPKEKSMKVTPAGSARVGDVLATLPLVKECTPNTKAKYYIYLLSAGWCGPCNAEMPHIVKAYEGIKASGKVELILVDFDNGPKQAQAYMDKYGATFPATMQDNGPALPGIQPPKGIPSAMIVDEMGNLVARGHGSIATQWKKRITEYEQKAGLPLSFGE